MNEHPPEENQHNDGYLGYLSETGSKDAVGDKSRYDEPTRSDGIE